MRRWKVTEVGLALLRRKHYSQSQPYISIKCSLGEGVFYNEERHELRFLVSSPNFTSRPLSGGRRDNDLSG
jgi:hypothetical protein